jgi:flagellar biosynthesis anti-sigma factor FlgM
MDIKDIKLRDVANGVVENKRQQQVQKYGEKVSQEQKLGVPSSSDTISFSNASKDLLKASILLDKDAEVRRSKIEDIKDRVAKGVYKIDSKEVAKSVISFVADGSVV